MYLGTALKLAIPFAILDREAMADAHTSGPDADAAHKACVDMRAIRGVKPSTFTAEQRETARMSLLWGEQYLAGFMDATGESDKAEFDLAKKQRQQIRRVRFEHFGNTVGEAAMKGCSDMPVGGRHNDKFFSMLSHVVCPVCKTRTNGASAGDLCRACKTGIFEQAQ